MSHSGRPLSPIQEATPGPNAFAQQAALRDQHHLDSNAFYQEAMRSRVATPPTAIHPALRAGRPPGSADLPGPPPAPSQAQRPWSPGVIVRDNEVLVESSPQMDFSPTRQVPPIPARYAFGDENHTLSPSSPGGRTIVHKRSISVPLLSPSKDTENAMSQHTGLHNNAARNAERTAAPLLSPTHSIVKTPKKSLRERLGFSVSKPPDRDISYTATSAREAKELQDAPPKARAVMTGSSSPRRPRLSLTGTTSSSLTSSPTNTYLARSPSKLKGFFNRSSATDSDSAVSPTSTVIHHPQQVQHPARKSSSKASEPSPPMSLNQVRRAREQIEMRRGQQQQYGQHSPIDCKDIPSPYRLKRFSPPAPPPPKKNTPPREQPRIEKSMRMPFQNTTSPGAPPMEGVISTSGRVSPTRFDTYGHRDVPRLVTQPSMYSLHASVVPNQSDMDALDDMRSRMDSLNLEGFSMPSEQNCQTVYSPSPYSTDELGRRNSMFQSRASYLPGSTAAAGAAHVRNGEHHVQRANASRADTESLKSATVPIMYPELRKDPSWTNKLPGQGENCNQLMHPVDESYSREMSRQDMAFHKDTWNRLTGTPGPAHQLPRYGHSVQALSRAHHLERPSETNSVRTLQAFPEPPSPEDPERRQTDELLNRLDEDIESSAGRSPASFSHKSAMVSPLQTLLATTYSPSSRKRGKGGFVTASKLSHQVLKDEPGAEYEYGESPTLGRPARRGANVVHERQNEPIGTSELSGGEHGSGAYVHSHMTQLSKPSPSSHGPTHNMSPAPHNSPFTPSANTASNILDSAPRLHPSPNQHTMADDTPTRPSRTPRESDALSSGDPSKPAPVHTEPNSASASISSTEDKLDRLITLLQIMDARNTETNESLREELHTGMSELSERIAEVEDKCRRLESPVIERSPMFTVRRREPMGSEQYRVARRVVSETSRHASAEDYAAAEAAPGQLGNGVEVCGEGAVVASDAQAENDRGETVVGQDSRACSSRQGKRESGSKRQIE